MVPRGRLCAKKLGGDLLSHPVSRAVPSALRGLTAVFGMGTGVSPSPLPPKKKQPHTSWTLESRFFRASLFSLSSSDPSLRAQDPPVGKSKNRRVKPHGPLVPVSSTCCHAFTSGLSTSSSSTGLQGTSRSQGDLVLGAASRLDAFSGYPFRT